MSLLCVYVFIYTIHCIIPYTTQAVNASIERLLNPWNRALLMNDTEIIEQTLVQKDEAGRDAMVNQTIPHFTAQQLPIHHLRNASIPPFAITKSLHAALIFKSRDVTEVLLRFGLSPLQTDTDGNNAVHALIFWVAMYRDQEEDLLYELTWFLRQQDQDIIKTLLLMENQHGMRPLECAANLHCFLFLDAIFNIPGVYLTIDEFHGYYRRKLYDVTDYEQFSSRMPARVWHSPTLLVLFVEKSLLGRKSTNFIFQNGPIAKWLEVRIKNNYPLLIMWFAHRVLVFLCFFIGTHFADISNVKDNLEHLNDTFSNHSNNDEFSDTISRIEFAGTILCAIAIFACIGNILCDVWDAYLHFRYLQHPWLLGSFRKVKNMVLNTLFFRVTHTTTSLSIIVVCACYLGKTCNDVVLQVLFFYSAFCIIWSLLFVYQMLPRIGLYAVAIQRMVQDFVKFLFVIFFCLLLYSLGFLRMLCDSHSRAWPKGFESIWSSIYTVFRIMQNAVDLRDYDVREPFVLFVMHVGFVLFVAILLINLLVASMTNSFEMIYNNSHVIMSVQRGMMAFLCQQRVATIFSPLYRLFRIRGFEEHDGRLYLVYVEYT